MKRKWGGISAPLASKPNEVIDMKINRRVNGGEIHDRVESIS